MATMLLLRCNKNSATMQNTKLSGIPETMLIPLWAKATETEQGGGLLCDKCAMQMKSQIDYNFSKFKKSTMSRVGCCVRGALIDEETCNFIGDNPNAVVIQLGAGLDARYQRIGMPKVTCWYDLDLKQGIEFREQLLPHTDNNVYLAQSMFDYSWIDRVKSHDAPVLIIIEGVLMYFNAKDVQDFFMELCTRFERATVLMDILAYVALKHARHHETLKKIDNCPEFKWSILDSNEMEAWHPKLHLGAEYYMSDHDNGRFPLILRGLYKIPYFYKRYNQRIVRMEIK